MKIVTGTMGKLDVRGLSTVNIGFFHSLQILFLITILIYIYFLKLFLFYLINGERRYLFGDVHLGQSCRLKNSSADALLNYL
jgi:hypothetical protein